MSSWTATSPRAGAAVAALALCAALLGCTTPLERAWGLSYREHVAQTIANPDAGKQDLEARRPDGQSTDSALVRYRTKETQLEAPPPPPVININTQ